MGYIGGSSGASGPSGHYELLHANAGAVRADNEDYEGTLDSIVLPADMAASDRLHIVLRVWRIGGTASPDFAEFYPWFGAPDAGGLCWPNTDSSALHYMGYLIDTSQGAGGLVAGLNQRNGGSSDPAFWTSTANDYSDMGELAGETLGLDVTSYLMDAGYHDWGWAWTVHRIRSH